MIFKYYYIYLVKNLLNNKIYVGFHASNKEYDQYLGSGTLIKKAIKLYGKNNFVKGIIEYVNENNWKEREIYWINKMNSHVSRGGYNLTIGGEGVVGLPFNGMLGKKHSQETKMKMKRPKTENHKQKLSDARKNKSYEEFYKEQASAMREKRKKQTTGNGNPNAKKYFIHNGLTNQSWMCYGNLNKFCQEFHVSGKTLLNSRKTNSYINNWKCEYLSDNHSNYISFE